MKRYLCFIILLLGISCTTSHNISKNQTKHDDADAKSAQHLTPNHITVETEMETSKTMTVAPGQGRDLGQGRTFAIKRLQLMLLPLMYKMGVMSTLLVVLVALSLKSLLIGVILLVLKIGSFLAKFHQPQPHVEPAQVPWSPSAHSWPQPWPQQQPIHVHVHNDDHPDPHNSHYHYDRQDQHVQDQVYSGWMHQPPSSNPYEKPVAIDSYGQYVFRG